MPRDNETNKSIKSPNKYAPRKAFGMSGGVTNTPDRGVNPEQSENKRTIELATDQSIAARNLLYNPNESSLAIMVRCGDGIGSIMKRLEHTGDDKSDLSKDEILVSMCTRLMSDGGNGRIEGFNQRLADLVVMKKEKPDSSEYTEAVRSLADDSRKKMAEITTTATIPGPEGARARHAILSFMGDLGGIERKETGFGSAYKGPLCEPELIYNSYVAGLCDAQLKLTGQKIPASDETVTKFEIEFDKSRKATSLKGGVLSAPAHTAGKKVERAPLSWKVEERRGLLNTGDQAESKLQEAYPGHSQLLLNASWPSYLVSKDLVKDVLEPVTGHVSGTFGEMVTTMNMFCGTPPETVTKENPSGTPISFAREDQVTAIGALAASGLITAGFHSAVEMFQPMSTFTTQATLGSLGPQAVTEMSNHAEALREYAGKLDTFGEARPERWEHNKCELSSEELLLDKETLLGKAESIEYAATKSVDMISLLQGEGGTLATLEISRLMANYSSDPKVPLKLFSLNTRLEDLGLRASTPELEAARTLAALPVSEEQQANLQHAIEAAEKAADRVDLSHKPAAEAAERVEIAVATTLTKEPSVANGEVTGLIEQFKSVKDRLRDIKNGSIQEPENVQAEEVDDAVRHKL